MLKQYRSYESSSGEICVLCRITKIYICFLIIFLHVRKKQQVLSIDQLILLKRNADRPISDLHDFEMRFFTYERSD